MTELTGSKQQIDWANDIRNRLAPQIQEHIARLEAKQGRMVTERYQGWEQDQEAVHEELRYLRAFLASSRADLWIAHARYQGKEIWCARGVGTAHKYGLPESPGWEAT